MPWGEAIGAGLSATAAAGRPPAGPPWWTDLYADCRDPIQRITGDAYRLLAAVGASRLDRLDPDWAVAVEAERRERLRAGLAVRAAAGLADPAAVAAAVERLYAAGLTLPAIAARLSLSVSSVNERLAAARRVGRAGYRRRDRREGRNARRPAHAESKR